MPRRGDRGGAGGALAGLLGEQLGKERLELLLVVDGVGPAEVGEDLRTREGPRDFAKLGRFGQSELWAGGGPGWNKGLERKT